MRRLLRSALAALAALWCATGADAAPLDPALQQQLLTVYGRYAKAIGAGKVNDALATRSAAARKRIQAALKDRKQRQALLAERFGLKFHMDSKDQNVYALVVNKGGVKMQEAAPEEAAPTPTPALEDRAFKPVVFPDGSVAYTPEQVQEYEQDILNVINL